MASRWVWCIFQLPLISGLRDWLARGIGRLSQGGEAGQVKAGLAGVGADQVAGMVVAYEPIWAIGTGRNATPEDAQATIATIRAGVRSLYDELTAGAVRIQYGGSVKPSNAAELMAQPDIDGALVGGASLDPDDFSRIVTAR